MKLERLPNFFTFLLIPFLGGNHLALLYVTIDRFWIETSFILLMLASIVIACCRKRWPDSNFYRFIIFFCPFVLATSFSLVYTWSMFNTLNEINVLIWGLGTAFLFFVTKDRDELLKGLVVGAALSALCAVWQLLVLFPNLLEIYREGGYAAMLQDQHVPFSSFLNQNMLGGYCASILPLGLYFAFVRGQKFYVVPVCLIMIGILISLSRLAVLTCIPSCAIIVVLLLKERGIRSIAPVATCVGLSAMLVLLMVYAPYRATHGGIQNTLEGKIRRSGSEAVTLNLRTDIWGTGLKAFNGNPWFGYGAGSFMYPYQKYYEGKQYTKVAHGTLVKVAVELGLLGLLCFLWYCFGVLRNLKIFFRKDRQILIVALSALVLFLFGLLDFSFDTAAHVITFICLTSVCFVPTLSGTTQSKAGILAVALIPIVLMSFVYTARADSSRRFVEDARLLGGDGGSNDEIRQSLFEAVEAMPLNNDALISLISSLTSSLLNETELPKKEGLKADLRGLVLRAERGRDKDPELLFVVGAAKRALGEGITSCEYMSRALTYHPSSACYALSAATCYAGYGQFGRALSIIRSMRIYYGNYRKWRYPDGSLVYKMRDLEAEIEYTTGNREQALALTRLNLQSARQDEFVITDWRARQSTSKEALVARLEQRVRSLETRIVFQEKQAAQTATY